MKPAGGFSRRTAVLVGILVVTTIAFAVSEHVRAKSRTPSFDDKLHGDAADISDAVDDLATRTPPAQMEAKLLRYSNDSNPILRRVAVEHLAAYKNGPAVDAEEHAFQDSSADVRYAAMYNVNGVDRERGLRLIASGLRDEDTVIREAAITDALAFGDKRLVPNLIDALDDPDPSVSHLDFGVLRRIARRPYYAKITDPAAEQRAVVRKWKGWWQTAQPHWIIDPSVAGATQIRPTRVDPAPNFDLPDIDGRPVSLDAQRGRITLLNFWGTWCPPCVGEVPDLERIDETYRGMGVNVIGIATSEKSADSVRDWCSNHNVAYRTALATDSILDDYGDIHEVPVSVLIDADGKIRYRWEGPRDYPTFSAAIDHLLAEQH